MKSFPDGYWSQQVLSHDDIPDSNKCQAKIFRLLSELFFRDFFRFSDPYSRSWHKILAKIEISIWKTNPCGKLDHGSELNRPFEPDAGPNWNLPTWNTHLFFHHETLYRHLVSETCTRGQGYVHLEHFWIFCEIQEPTKDSHYLQ